jgi:hypothetical protein
MTTSQLPRQMAASAGVQLARAKAQSIRPGATLPQRAAARLQARYALGYQLRCLRLLEDRRYAPAES